MFIPPEKLCLVRELITKLYTRPFDEALVLNVADSVCKLVDGHYFALSIPNPTQPLLLSNNPPEFIPVYLSVAKSDFLLDTVVASRQETVLHRILELETIPKYRVFSRTVQDARPISDIIYIPVSRNGIVMGHWGLGRDGLNSPIYSDNEIELFKFLASFLNDALERSLVPPPLDEEVAFLDCQGHVVSMGLQIKNAFAALFGKGIILELKSCCQNFRALFLKKYRRFLHGNFQVGMDRLTLRAHGKTFRFLFKLLRPQGIPLRLDGLPYASVQLLTEPVDQDLAHTVALPKLNKIYQFTPRESEVVLGILEGKRNKEISAELGIEEATVKWYTHGIYEKTGLRSRTELVLGLSSASRPN